jgi:hypothetical protein
MAVIMLEIFKSCKSLNRANPDWYCVVRSPNKLMCDHLQIHKLEPVQRRK